MTSTARKRMFSIGRPVFVAAMAATTIALIAFVCMVVNSFIEVVIKGD